MIFFLVIVLGIFFLGISFLVISLVVIFRVIFLGLIFLAIFLAICLVFFLATGVEGGGEDHDPQADDGRDQHAWAGGGVKFLS